jgi:hypothetical protein
MNIENENEFADESYYSLFTKSKMNRLAFNQEQWLKLDSKISYALLNHYADLNSNLIKELDVLYAYTEMTLPNVPAKDKKTFDLYESINNRLHIMDTRRSELESI